MVAAMRKARGVQSWLLENFGGGLDLRETYFTLDQNRFADLQNLYITKGRKLRRRPPCILASGSFGANTMGLFQLNGSLYTLIPKGQANVGTPPGVSTLAFDLPPGASTWSLVDVTNLNTTVCALIRHTIGATTQLWLHVFDSAPDLPTYVQDPAFPWTHQLAATGRAVLSVAANKLWVSGPDFNAYHSATALPRLWSTKAIDDLNSTGYEFHLYLAATGLQTVTVPVDRTLIGVYSKGYQAWCVEQYTGPTSSPNYDAATNWGTRLTEVLGVGAIASGQCGFSATPNGAAITTYSSWLAVTINAAATGWYRVRIVPPKGTVQQINNYVVSGLLSPGQTTKVQYFVKGDGATKRFLVPSDTFYPYGSSTAADVDKVYTVTVDGAVKTNAGADYSIATGPDGILFIFPAAPASGAVLEFDQNIKAKASDAFFVIPPGVISTVYGSKSFAGGVLAFTPAAATFYSVYVRLDANANVTGVGYDLAPVVGNLNSGKSLLEGVLVLIYATDSDLVLIPVYSASFTGTVKPFDNTAMVGRDLQTDATLHAAALAAVGDGDAGFIASSQFESAGGPITFLAAAKNRLLVGYRAATELWVVNEDATKDRLIESSAIGSGTQPNAYGVPFFGQVIIPSATGFRAIDVSRQLSDDNLNDLDIGNPIAPLGSPAMSAQGYWPWQGEYVAAVSLGGALTFLVFDYSKEAKIAAWSKWSVVGLTSVDYKGIAAVDDRLYVRSGSSLYYFDASATVFQDSNDTSLTLNPGGLAYTSLAMWHFNNMKRPESTKRFTGVELIVDGQAVITFRTQPHNFLFEEGPITWTGPSIGKPSLPMCMNSRAMAPVIRSNDVTGFNLEAVVLNFVFLGQGVL